MSDYFVETLNIKNPPNRIGGVCIDQQGYLYITDSEKHKVYKMVPSLCKHEKTTEYRMEFVADIPLDNPKEKQKLLTKKRTPMGIAVDSKGTLFICDKENDHDSLGLSNEKKELTRQDIKLLAGSARENEGPCAFPMGLVVDSETDLIYVCVKNDIKQIDAKNCVTSLLTSHIPGNISPLKDRIEPHAILIDHRRHLLVTDKKGKRI